MGHTVLILSTLSIIYLLTLVLVSVGNPSNPLEIPLPDYPPLVHHALARHCTTTGLRVFHGKYAPV